MNFLRKKYKIIIAVIGFSTYIIIKDGLSEGLMELFGALLMLALIMFICWILWRIFTGSWIFGEWPGEKKDNKKISRETIDDFAQYSIKLIINTIIVLVLAVLILAIFIKVFIHTTTGSW